MRSQTHAHASVGGCSPVCCCCECVKPYGFGHFLFDCIMVLITSGLWLIWIFVREMRKRNR